MFPCQVIQGKDVSLGDRLKAERNRLGFSQASLADQVGIAKKSQTNYELGHTLPAADYLAAAADAGIDVMYVLTGRQSAAMSGDERELIRRYRLASPDVQTAVMAGLGAVVISDREAKVAVHGGEQGQIIAGDAHQSAVTINVGGKKRGTRK